jgi:hypothetical protein
VSGRLGHANSPCGTGAVRPQTLPDTAAATVRPAVQVPDTRGRTAASDVQPVAVVLGEPVAGSAATGGIVASRLVVSLAREGGR